MDHPNGHPTFPFLFNQANLAAPVNQGIGNMLAHFSGMPFCQIPIQSDSSSSFLLSLWSPLVAMMFQQNLATLRGTRFAVPAATRNVPEEPSAPTEQQITGFVRESSTAASQFGNPSLPASNSTGGYQMPVFPLRDSPSRSSISTNNEELPTTSSRKRKRLSKPKKVAQVQSNPWSDKRTRHETPFQTLLATECDPAGTMDNGELLRLSSPIIPTTLIGAAEYLENSAKEESQREKAEGELRINQLKEEFKTELNEKEGKIASLQETYDILSETTKNDLERAQAAHLQQLQEAREAYEKEKKSILDLLNAAQEARKNQDEKFQKIMREEKEKWEAQIQEVKRAARANLEHELAKKSEEIKKLDQMKAKKAMDVITAAVKSMNEIFEIPFEELLCHASASIATPAPTLAHSAIFPSEAPYSDNMAPPSTNAPGLFESEPVKK